MTRDRRFSIPKKKRFIEALARGGNVVQAAATVGVSHAHVYWVRKRDPAFAEQWEEALDMAMDGVESEMRRRAVDGWEEPVFYRGEQVGAVRRYSDSLLVTLLKAHRPEKYRENYRVEQQPSGNHLIEALERARARVEAGRRANEEERKEEAEEQEPRREEEERRETQEGGAAGAEKRPPSLPREVVTEEDRQHAVSRLETRGDMHISTLREFLEAMGGELELVAKFPDRPPGRLARLGETPARRKRWKAA